MNNEQNRQFSEFLQKLANTLDISESLYQKVEERYQSISRWLGRDNSTILIYNPKIFPQGSIQLGTIIKPITDADEYDIDLVCQLQISKEDIAQQQLKQLVGDEIKGYAKSNNFKSPVEEGRRCWRLDYSDSAQFHADILPAIPEGEKFKTFLMSKNVNRDFSEHAIAITDNTLPEYGEIYSNWPQSNPKGYALWFREQMRPQYAFAKNQLAEKSRVEISAVPDYKVKTPLQRAIQILKRHRDIMFADDKDDKPISIIITTLAALAYRNEADLIDALKNIIVGMPNYIGTRNGETWIPNPVNPSENFADKWTAHPKRKENFENWLFQVKNDFELAFEANDVLEFSESLKLSLGETTINKALKSIQPAQEKSLKLSVSDYSLANYSHAQKPEWPIEISGKVEISGTITRKNVTPTTTQTKTIYLNSGMAVGTSLSIEFAAKISNISKPYEIFWQVVNTGADARIANDLRGGFFPGFFDDGRRHSESTRYKGVHWIQCFVVKNEKCVARSKKFIVNIR